uniref:LysR family transcriptional regulator n=1 Tax=Haemonchus placei TaxID=6290 RepID=A0A0N4VVQ4_HAEPC
LELVRCPVYSSTRSSLAVAMIRQLQRKTENLHKSSRMPKQSEV